MDSIDFKAMKLRLDRYRYQNGMTINHCEFYNGEEQYTIFFQWTVVIS